MDFHVKILIDIPEGDKKITMFVFSCCPLKNRIFCPQDFIHSLPPLPSLPQLPNSKVTTKRTIIVGHQHQMKHLQSQLWPDMFICARVGCALGNMPKKNTRGGRNVNIYFEGVNCWFWGECMWTCPIRGKVSWNFTPGFLVVVVGRGGLRVSCQHFWLDLA